MSKYLCLFLLFLNACKEINDYPTIKVTKSIIHSSVIYEFTPRESPYKQCVAIITGLGVGLDCWDKK